MPFDLNAATREVCALLSAELARENVLLEARLAEPLPPAVGNRVQIQQIIVNLARNAIEAMRAVNARRILTISTEQSPEGLSLRVADTGPGAPSVDPERLSAPLYTTKAGGMGLGLSISRKLALAHGGALNLEPREGVGAVFHLLLPWEPPAHD